MKTFEFNLNHYISFDGTNSLKNQIKRDPLLFSKIDTIKKVIKKPSSKCMYAKFSYNKNNLKRADLDNILLYNLHINKLDELENVSLEKVESDREDFGYEFSFDDYYVAPIRNTILTFKYLPFGDSFTKKGFDKTKNLYRHFRWTLLSEHLLTKQKYDPTKKYGLNIVYLGNTKITEEGFLKPIIDAFISALHKFSYSSTKGIEDLVGNFENVKDEYFMENINGGDLITKAKRFNPMDEMFSMIQVSHRKTKKDDEIMVFELFEY